MGLLGVVGKKRLVGTRHCIADRRRLLIMHNAVCTAVWLRTGCKVYQLSLNITPPSSCTNEMKQNRSTTEILIIFLD
jgi:hypothetical protein